MSDIDQAERIRIADCMVAAASGSGDPDRMARARFVLDAARGGLGGTGACPCTRCSQTR